MPKITLSEEAKTALRLMEKTSQNVFLTGKAGTGKSTLLEIFRHYSKKRCAVIAPTGVAAINVHGETIHAFFGLKPGFELEEAMQKNVNKQKASLFRRLETIIIDEISMVRADILEAINIRLQKARQNPAPFGGVQMVFIGDLYQLPPVVTRDEKEVFAERYDTPFFFAAEIFNRPDFKLEQIELKHIYRQTNSDFINLLNAIRDKTATHQHLRQINTRVERGQVDDSDCLYLMTTNRDAQTINNAKLAEIEEDIFEHQADFDGAIENYQFPTEDILELKIGAQIMFVNNDSERRWVNGTLGIITAIDEFEEMLTVKTFAGKEVEVTPHTWEISKYILQNKELKREKIGSFTQLPVKLAWAMTIHKSQGKTFSKVIIDLGRGSFAHGQTYVALSRCRSLEGIVLRKPVRQSDIILDTKVVEFFTK